MFTVNPEFFKVINEGKFYYPAHLHYNGENKVICDRCHRNDLKCCFGIEGGEVDLCLKCVDELVNEIPLDRLNEKTETN